jgi:small conductance mechanosensitive channel
LSPILTTASFDQLRAAVFLFGGRLAIASVVLVAYVAVGRVTERLVRRLARRSAEAREVVGFLAHTAKIAVLGLGVVSALGTLGVNVNGLVAGLGLTGFAVGFALKDALSNALCGILIHLYRPFRPGDRVSVTGFEGTVSAIDLRYTTIAQADGGRVLIPNSALFSNPVAVGTAVKTQPKADAAAVADPLA